MTAQNENKHLKEWYIDIFDWWTPCSPITVIDLHWSYLSSTSLSHWRSGITYLTRKSYMFSARAAQTGAARGKNWQVIKPTSLHILSWPWRGCCPWHMKLCGKPSGGVVCYVWGYTASTVSWFCTWRRAAMLRWGDRGMPLLILVVWLQQGPCILLGQLLNWTEGK